MKTCSDCKEEKSIDVFWKQTKEKIGPRCAPCAKLTPFYLNNISKLVKERKVKHIDSKEVIERGTMKCKKCELFQPLEYYSRSNRKCKVCLAAHLRERRKTLVREPTTEPQVCKKCLVNKPAKEFTKSKEAKNGINRVCKTCVKNRGLKE